MLQFVSDVVTSSGKTIREENLEMKHNIPLGTLVEVVYEELGIRAYVVDYARDCDGTPMYRIGLNQNSAGIPTKEELQDKWGMESLTAILTAMGRNSFYGNYGEESLAVVKSPTPNQVANFASKIRIVHMFGNTRHVWVLLPWFEGTAEEKIVETYYEGLKDYQRISWAEWNV